MIIPQNNSICSVASLLMPQWNLQHFAQNGHYKKYNKFIWGKTKHIITWVISWFKSKVNFRVDAHRNIFAEVAPALLPTAKVKTNDFYLNVCVCSQHEQKFRFHSHFKYSITLFHCIIQGTINRNQFLECINKNLS